MKAKIIEITNDELVTKLKLPKGTVLADVNIQFETQTFFFIAHSPEFKEVIPRSYLIIERGD